MTKEELDACEARANAATPGPWEAGAKITKRVYIASSLHRIADTLSTADATFIAAARTDVPTLVARVRDLEAQLARERAFREEQRSLRGAR